jgi:hypothetical protein
MTIPDVGRCAGSSGPPFEASVERRDGEETGLCPACSGRFPLSNGILPEHETTPQQERESLSGS